MSVDAATFTRAAEVYDHRQLCAHEAAHTAAALILGLPVHDVSAPFWKAADVEAGDPDSPAGQLHIRRCDGDEHARKMAVATIAGPLEESRANWPPTWPLSLAPSHGDEADLCELVKTLGLDRDGYGQLVAEALELTGRPEFSRLTAAIAHMLERHAYLDAATLDRIKAITEGAEVDHLTLKAVTTTTTDQGIFEAVISTESVDREKDVVDASAMVTALRKWNRPIPLAWNHSSAAEDIIGAIDPQTVREVNGEVVAGGEVDLQSNVGSEAWRSFKSRTIGFSFGYLILTASKRADGGRHITALDIFEVTSTPTPMNNDTRVLNTKALDPDMDRVRAEWHDVITGAMGATTTDPDRLRAKAQRIARECAPITVTEFPC